jgi:hypothetical protein
MPTPSEQPWWQRYTTELIVVAVGLLVVVGLWVRNRPDDSPAVDPQVTTTTVDASDVTAPEDEPGDELVEPVADGEGSASLSKAVLRSGDLPKGWAAIKVDGDLAPLCEGRNPFARVPAAGTARAAFSKGTSGDAITGTVAHYDSTAQAESLLDGIRDDAAACRRAGTDYTVSSLGGVGDEAVQLTVSVPVGPSTLRVLVTVAREGDHVAMVSATGDPDEALVVRALKAELGRL